MRDWIIIFFLYAFVAGLFRILGGFRSAGDAIRRWGEASSTVRSSASSSS